MEALNLLSKLIVVLYVLLVTSNAVEERGLNSNLSHRKLKRSNKSPVKSIKSPDGDIIDCFYFEHQPTLNHPSLKNHTVQVRPNYHPAGDFTVSEVPAKGSNSIPQAWHLSGRCPKGTIPIRRTSKDDILRANSVKTFDWSKHKTIQQSTTPTSPIAGEFATAYVDRGLYYGAKATMNVWKPKVQQQDEYSASQIWILGYDVDSTINSIEAGWQVFPALYKDNNTRFFIYWMSNQSSNTGCYDLTCSGFIQINNDIAIGGTISPLSTYGGHQYEITIKIWKDPKTGDWWLVFGENIILGYWPEELFPGMVYGATTVMWGGAVLNKRSAGGAHTTTEMGSGHFPEEFYRKSSYFKYFQFVDGSNTLRVPENLQTFAHFNNCYNIKDGKLKGGELYFFYGGPGRNAKCP